MYYFMDMEYNLVVDDEKAIVNIVKAYLEKKATTWVTPSTENAASNWPAGAPRPHRA